MCSWVSSANCCWPTLWLLAMRAIGETNMVNRMGPRTGPCETPVQQAVEVERELPIRTNWLRSWRYDNIQFNAMCETPRDVWSLARRMLWSMLSKTELMSSDTRSVEFTWLMELRILAAVASIDSVTPENFLETDMLYTSFSTYFVVKFNSLVVAFKIFWKEKYEFSNIINQ